MPETLYRGRRAMQVENRNIRVTVLAEGGHVAEILDKRTGVNPLWTPPWPSIEPSTYDPALHPGYGGDAESKLLAGIMGHNLCLDLFGGPSPEEAASGLTVHGEASIAPYELSVSGEELRARALLPLAQLAFERRIQLQDSEVIFEERVENLSALDRPIAWTQHVTLGPPFLRRTKTLFDVSATQSRTYEGEFGEIYARGLDFEWPHAPRRSGGTVDLRSYTGEQSSAGYTAHLMDRGRETAFFHAWSPGDQLLFGYRWKRSDFPWLGMWIENQSRQPGPWGGKTMTCGMEFGVSPMPEQRRQMIDRGKLFGVPSYRWLPAGSTAQVTYSAFVRRASEMPTSVERPAV